MGLWYIGVGIYLVGRSSMALGGNLQRYSMDQESKKPIEEQRKRTKQPILVTGFILFVGSGIVLSSAVVFAPQSLLAPCGIVFIIANAIFASKLNGEDFVWKEDGVCTAFIMIGVTMCVIAAPKEEEGQGDKAVKTYTKEELVQLYQSWTFIVFVVGAASIVAGFLYANKTILREFEYDWDKLKMDRRKMTIINLSFGFMAGVLGGFNITLTKSMFSVLGGEAENGILSLLSSWALYVLGITLLFTFVFQMLNVTDGLERCNALVVLPCQSVAEEVTAAIGGILYFQDYKQFSTWSALVFLVGDSMCVVSVIVMVFLRMGHEAEEEDRKARELAMSGAGEDEDENNPLNVGTPSGSKSPSRQVEAQDGAATGHGYVTVALDR